MMKPFLFLFLTVCLLSLLGTAQKVSSPSGNLVVTLDLSPKGEPMYSATYKGHLFVNRSKLGFRLKNQDLFSEQFIIRQFDTLVYDETWKPVWGEVNQIRNTYHQLRVVLEQQTTGRKLNILFKVFDDGVGFRYEFPEQPKLRHFVIDEELTQFHLGHNYKAFWIPGDYDTNEYYYATTTLSEIDATNAESFSEISLKTPVAPHAVQTPLMLTGSKGLYINIHEAALVNYPAMQLLLDKKTYTFQTKLTPDAVGHAAFLQTPAVTPWRTILVSDRAVDLLNSKLILNLNEPSKIRDSSWIRPQKMVGLWWEMHVGKSSWDKASGKHGATTANTKRYIDFASEHGFDGVLVEGWNRGWEDWYGNWKEDVFDFVTPYPDYDLDELHRYAQQKGVRLVMHHETSGAATNYEFHMDTAYRLMKKMNMNLVKTGYVGRVIPRGEHHDGQWMVKHYNRVLEKAAGYQIMVNAHEPVRPTGLHRTWPNFLACEAARGNEFNAWSVGNPPEHETILPFTRLLGGPMDYTPGIFRLKLDQFDPASVHQVHTTLCKQLALYVTFYSPLQMAADLIENYDAKPDAFQFIKDVPVDWDESRYLMAEPGDYVVVARKGKGTDHWYIGAVTDENARSFKVSLDFLKPGQPYLIKIYRDADDAHWQDNPEAYTIESFVIHSRRSLNLRLAAGGGCAVQITPIVSRKKIAKEE